MEKMNGRLVEEKERGRRKVGKGGCKSYIIYPSLSPSDLRLIISNYDLGRLSAVPHGRAPSFDPFGTPFGFQGFARVKARRGVGRSMRIGRVICTTKRELLAPFASFDCVRRQFRGCRSHAPTLPPFASPRLATCIDNFYPPPLLRSSSTSLIESSLSGTTDCLTPLSHRSNPSLALFTRRPTEALRFRRDAFFPHIRPIKSSEPRFVPLPRCQVYKCFYTGFFLSFSFSVALFPSSERCFASRTRNYSWIRIPVWLTIARV